MVGAQVVGPDMVCGGVSTLLIEYLADPFPYRLALERLTRGERVLFVKRLPGVTAGTDKLDLRLLDESGTPLFGRADRPGDRAAGQALDRGKPWFDPDAGVFYDPVFPQEKLLILGGGHVGQALAAQAPALGFAVTVADERPEYLAPERFPAGVDTILGGFAPAIADFPFDGSTYAVVVSRGHLTDLECVRALLLRPYRYAGFMGSGRKCSLIIDQVLADGTDPAKVATLCGPIGLEIGAETPAELANAILGEMIAVRRNARVLPELKRARESRRA
jgi:xanthine dehydrogenase accessory factor